MDCPMCTCKQKTRRERKEELRRYVLDHIFSRRIMQDQPYTCVEIEVSFPGKKPIFVAGFSKVRWPDKWDEEYGVRIAFDKAVAKVVKELLDEGVSAPCCE